MHKNNFMSNDIYLNHLKTTSRKIDPIISGPNEDTKFFIEAWIFYDFNCPTVSDLRKKYNLVVTNWMHVPIVLMVSNQKSEAVLMFEFESEKWEVPN